MKIVQVITKAGIDSKLKTLLKNTERQPSRQENTYARPCAPQT